MRSKTALAIAVALLLALVSAACSATEQPQFDPEAIPDPVSTRDLAGGGGASVGAIEFSDLADRSIAAIEATIIDVRRSRANTIDGDFPKIDTSLGPDQLNTLFPMTEVEVMVETVFGDRGDLDNVMKSGDLVLVTVGGGQLHTILSPEEAKALGVLIEADEPPGSSDDGEVNTPTGPEAEPGEGTYPTEPTQFSRGLAPSATLTEGERVILFLSRQQRPAHGSDDTLAVLGLTHPHGVFHEVSAGVWRSELAPETSLDALELARSVG